MKVFKRILSYSAPYYGRIILAAIAALVVGGMDGALAYLVGPILQKIFVSRDLLVLKILPFAVVAMYVVKGGCRFLNEYYLRSAGQLAIQDIRNEVFEKNVSLGVRYFSSNPTGAMMSRVLNDVNIK